jgi:Chs5-Arf1p-binding protein BUD7/BCH1
MTQYRTVGDTSTKQLLYRKTGSEWEVYGDLSDRLEHPDDARVLYRLCLEQKFSAKSWLKLMGMAAKDGNIKETLAGAVKLVSILDRAYVESTVCYYYFFALLSLPRLKNVFFLSLQYPSPIGRAIYTIIKLHGYQKVQNVLIAMNVPQRQFRLVTRFLE